MGKSLVFGKRYEYNNEYFDRPLKLGSIALYQVGELFCEAGFQVKPHRQNTLEISYIVTGEGTFITDGHECVVRQDDVYINRLNQMHIIRADKGVPLRYFYLAFNFCENSELEFPDSVRDFFTNGPEFLLSNNKELLNAFSSIFSELQSNDEFFDLMLKSSVKQLIVNTYRYFKKKNEPSHRIAFNENSLGSAVYTVVRYIDQNYRNITDIRAVAHELGYSYTYLAHVFKEKMDMTIGNYVIKKKMEEGKELLQTGRMNVTQVAERLHYMSIQSFSNSFRKIYGISPTEYLKQFQQNK